MAGSGVSVMTGAGVSVTTGTGVGAAEPDPDELDVGENVGVNVVSSCDPVPLLPAELLELGDPLVLALVEPLLDVDEQPLPVQDGVSIVGVGVSISAGVGVVDSGVGVVDPDEDDDQLPFPELPDALVEPLSDTDVQPLPVQDDEGAGSGVEEVGSGVAVVDTGEGVSMGVAVGASVATSHLLGTKVGVGVELATALSLLEPVSPQTKFGTQP